MVGRAHYGGVSVRALLETLHLKRLDTVSGLIPCWSHNAMVLKGAGKM